VCYKYLIRQKYQFCNKHLYRKTCCATLDVAKRYPWKRVRQHSQSKQTWHTLYRYLLYCNRIYHRARRLNPIRTRTRCSEDIWT